MTNNDEIFKLTEEDIKVGIEDYFTQLLIEARRKKSGARTLDALSSTTPTIVYVVGQTGDGKTTLSKCREQQYNEKGEVIVETGSDKIATYHRYYAEVSKLPTDERLRITRQFVRPAESQIYGRIRENNISMIRECLLNKEEADYAHMQTFKDSGYQVEIDVMAVDKYESFLSCIERDTKLIELGFAPRPIPREYHDQVCDPLINELGEISRRGLSTRINIYTRGKSPIEPELAWTSEGEDTRYPNAQEAILEERAKQRRRILQKPQEYLARIEQARERITLMVQDKKVRENYLKDLRELEKEFLRELAYDRNVGE